MTLHQLEAAARSALAESESDAPTSGSSSIPDLVPWADPYIADLHRQHAHEMRRERVTGEAAGFNGQVRSSGPPRRSHYESPPRERRIRSRTPNVRAW
jgi:hypothetical protein